MLAKAEFVPLTNVEPLPPALSTTLLSVPPLWVNVPPERLAVVISPPDWVKLPPLRLSVVILPPSPDGPKLLPPVGP